MFSWLQNNTKLPNLTLSRVFNSIILWLATVMPLSILELINIFPIFVENYAYNEIDKIPFIVLISWTLFVRLIFAFIVVDENGSIVSLICFKEITIFNQSQYTTKPLPNYNKYGQEIIEPHSTMSDELSVDLKNTKNNNNNNLTSNQQKHNNISNKKKSSCWLCTKLFRFIGQLILQIFYLALPLLPTTGISIRLHKQNASKFAQWNHFCMCTYLILTYLPMLYIILPQNS